jgi:uncharacterized protein YggL (DUF469 family)
VKKRLRKKLRLREFQELGFTLDFDTDPDDEAAYNFLSDNLDNLLESLGYRIVFGYGTLFVRSQPYQSVVAADRQLIIDWMQQQPKAINLGFGPLADFKLTQRVHLRKPKWKSLPRK